VIHEWPLWGIVRVWLLSASKSIAVGTAWSWRQTVLVNVPEPTGRHTIIDLQPVKCCLNSGKFFLLISVILCDSHQGCGVRSFVGTSVLGVPAASVSWYPNNNNNNNIISIGTIYIYTRARTHTLTHTHTQNRCSL
jgi:hypothetical protein